MIKEQQPMEQLVMEFFNAPHLRLNKNIICVYGIDIALWIADVFSRWNYFLSKNKLDKENFFFVSQKEIRESTALNFNKQTEIVKRLSEDKIIEVERRGLPKRNHYKINIFQLIKLVNLGKLKAQELCNTKDKEFEIQRTSALSDKDHNKNNINNNKSNNNKDIFINKNMDCKSNPNDSSSNPDSNKKPFNKNTFTEPKDCSEDVQSLFEFWQDLKIVVHRKSKARDQALEKLNIKFQHHPVQEIKRAMQTYKDLLDNPYNILKPRTPYKVGLDEFFGFNPHTKDVIKKSYKTLQIRSWFNECLKGGEYLGKYDCLRKDGYPNVTKKLKKEYSRVINHLPETLPAIEENSFRKASSLLVEFIKKHDKKLRVPLGDIRNPVQFVKYVFEYFERRNQEGINPGWLCSDFFYDSFTAWMKRQSYL